MADKKTPEGKDDLLFNKIAGAILGSLLMVMVFQEVGAVTYRTQGALEEPAYIIDIPEGPAVGDVAAEVIDLGTLLATADLAKGERVAKKCVSCHTFDQGGDHGQGPNLFGILGAARARIAEFNYSSAMTEFGGSWAHQDMFDYLLNPKKYVKGTNMAFAGIRKPEDRANLVAYLQSLSPDAPSAPEPAAPVEAPKAPAE
jgi:cytochrome c